MLFLFVFLFIVNMFVFQGLRRSEQAHLIEMYRARNPNQGEGTQNSTNSSNTPEPESSRIKKLEKLIKKRLWCCKQGVSSKKRKRKYFCIIVNYLTCTVLKSNQDHIKILSHLLHGVC